MFFIFYVFICFKFLSQEEVAFENCKDSTVADTIELPQDNVCEEPIEEPRYYV